MSTAAPHDGESNIENLKEDLKHPFEYMRHKLHNTTLHDMKVKATLKK
jgi:phospholipase D1/2